MISTLPCLMPVPPAWLPLRLPQSYPFASMASLPHHRPYPNRPKLDDMAAGAKRIVLEPEHTNTITDLISIVEKELVVTSSLDRRICVWQVTDTLRDDSPALANSLNPSPKGELHPPV